MRSAYVFGCACLVLGLWSAAPVRAGTAILPLANVTPKCIDASKKTVDLWVLSARVPSKANWLRQTKSVGARVDVTLRPQEGQSVSFPAAAAIDTSDDDDKVVRASLQLHVLANQDLWNTSPAQPIKTIDVSVPLTFIRRQGDSNTVKMFQALLAFSKVAGAAVPANPYAKGAELVGQLSASIANAFAPDPNDVVDPNFSLAFSVARNGNCGPKDLRDSVGVSISDFSGGQGKQGYIATADVGKYCFYKTGDDVDPNIAFVRRNGGTCPATAPDAAVTLFNPQFIWMATAHCKEGVRCEGSLPPPPLALNLGRQLLHADSKAFELASDRLDDKESKALAKALTSTSAPAPLPDRARELLDAVAMCHSVGISEERCLDKSFSAHEL